MESERPGNPTAQVVVPIQGGRAKLEGPPDMSLGVWEEVTHGEP